MINRLNKKQNTHKKGGNLVCFYYKMAFKTKIEAVWFIITWKRNEKKMKKNSQSSQFEKSAKIIRIQLINSRHLESSDYGKLKILIEFLEKSKIYVWLV